MLILQFGCQLRFEILSSVLDAIEKGRASTVHRTLLQHLNSFGYLRGSRVPVLVTGINFDACSCSDQRRRWKRRFPLHRRHCHLVGAAPTTHRIMKIYQHATIGRAVSRLHQTQPAEPCPVSFAHLMPTQLVCRVLQTTAAGQAFSASILSK